MLGVNQLSSYIERSVIKMECRIENFIKQLYIAKCGTYIPIRTTNFKLRQINKIIKKLEDEDKKNNVTFADVWAQNNIPIDLEVIMG